jgi:hypothetical protein
MFYNFLKIGQSFAKTNLGRHKNFKQIWQYRQFIWDVGSQNNLLTTSASACKGCRSLKLGLHYLSICENFGTY